MHSGKQRGHRQSELVHRTEAPLLVFPFQTQQVGGGREGPGVPLRGFVLVWFTGIGALFYIYTTIYIYKAVSDLGTIRFGTCGLASLRAILTACHRFETSRKYTVSKVK